MSPTSNAIWLKPTARGLVGSVIWILLCQPENQVGRASPGRKRDIASQSNRDWYGATPLPASPTRGEEIRFPEFTQARTGGSIQLQLALAPSVRLAGCRVRRLLPLGQPGLAQALGDALILRVEGRIVGPMDARPFLHADAWIDFLKLRHGLLGLLVVAGPGVGRGEIDEGVPIRRRARD